MHVMLKRNVGEVWESCPCHVPFQSHLSEALVRPHDLQAAPEDLDEIRYMYIILSGQCQRKKRRSFRISIV